jgi:transposase
MGKRVDTVESAHSIPLEAMIVEMSGKDMSYRQMAKVLGVAVSHIQVWMKRMGLGKAKRGAKKKPILSVEALKQKFQLSF